MVDRLESTFDALHISTMPSPTLFYPRKGFETIRGSELHKFYVVLVGRVPGVYTHWEEASAQVVSFSNAPAMYTIPAPARPSTNPIKMDVAPAPNRVLTGLRSTPMTQQATSSAPSTPTGSKKPVFVYSRGRDTTIFADVEQASAAARRGLADGSFGKVEVTTGIGYAFELAAESALAVIDISDTEDD
ncbi:hypothetical protein C8R45DRAFT_1113571 [Mycena sanguinolenta]|nr:hypothetical protein C8R45DRAFT_1113571 [Mycena sanguinolenta]